MSDAVLKIGAIVDKEAIASGMDDGADAVSAGTVKMATSFQELQGRASGSWKKISADTKEAAATVSVESIRIAESTKGVAVAQADLRAALNLTKNANVDAAVSTAVLAAAQDSARLKAMELRAAQMAIAESSHAAVSGVQATSGAIRSLEGNAGLRAVENFVSKTLGLGPAMQAIFPLVGAVAFGTILFSIGEKIYDVGEKAIHAAKAIDEAFGAMHDKALITNDDLRVQDDKLKDEIAKLSGSPGNGLQTSLDEAIKRCDQLVVSLHADRKELEALFKDNAVGFVGGVMGKGPTGQQKKELLGDNQNLTDSVSTANESYVAAMDAAKKDVKLTNDERAEVIKKAGVAHAAAISGAFQVQIVAYRKEATRLENEVDDFGKKMDNSAKVSNLKGVISQLRDRKSTFDLIEDTSTDEATVGSKKQAKVGEGEDNKAAEMRLKQMDSDLAQLKINGPLTAQAEYDYWDARRNGFASGSEQYNAVVEKQAALAEAGARRAHDFIARMKAASQKDQEEASKVNAVLYSPAATAMGTEALNNFFRTGEKWDVYWKEVATGTEIQAKISAELEESRVKAMAAAGAITPLAAAERLAAIHTKEHTEAVKALEVELAGLEKLASRDPFTGRPNDPKQAAQIQQVQNQVTQQKGAGAAQGQQDKAAISGAIAKPYLTAFDQINNGWLKVQNDLIAGNRRIGRDFREIALSMVQSAAVGAEKMLADAARVEIRKLALRRATVAGTTQADAAGAATSDGISAISALKQANHAAAVAAGKAWSAMADIPIVGPELGAVAAAATYAGVMALAAFEKGGVVAGSPGMAVPILAHSGERVLSTTQTTNFERMVNNTSSSKGDVHIHMAGHTFHGAAGGDVIAQLQRQPRELSKLIARMRREGTL